MLFSTTNNNNWKNYYIKVSSGMEIITFALSVITLLVAMVDNNISIKLFNICGVLALLTLLVRANNANYNWKLAVLPISMLLIGIIDLIWYSLFKVDNSPFRATYHNYLNTARIFIFGTFIVLLAAASKIRIKKDSIFFLFYSISFIVFGFALYQKMSTGLQRVDFGIGTSTGAAYSIMLIGLISAISVFYTQKNHPFLFILNACMTLAALAMTQTRSSMLIFPVICCIAIAINYNKTPRRLFFAVCSFIALLTLLGLIFSKAMVERYESAVRDITLYQQHNQHNSSLGARLAMYEVGSNLLLNDPVKWRSAEERESNAKEMISQQKELAVTLKYLNMHLHNEIIEASSLKGVTGAASILLFYIALLFSVYSFRSSGLFVFALAIIGTGLSDVIIWARSIPIIICCGIAVLILFYKENRVQ